MRILSVCSARPNFVKLAAVHHAVRVAKNRDVDHVIVHTGQHYDPLFSDVFFEQLQIPLPHVNLEIHGGTREDVITRTEKAIVPVLTREDPDVILVYGDVNGALGAARGAIQAGLPIAHVEAGLRSFDQSMPEETNRIAIDMISQLLFCTEKSGVEHLRSAHVNGAVHLVGNTMIDTLVRMLPAIERQDLPRKVKLPFAVATLHRPSNVDSKDALEENLRFLASVSSRCRIVLPAHHRLESRIDEFQLRSLIPKTVHLTGPLGYLPFLRLVQQSLFVLTDSGGIQEEATFLKKRCFTLRKNTERPSTIESGSNVLIDIDQSRDRQVVLAYAESPVPPDVTIPPLWDGKAGERILSLLLSDIL